MSGRYLFDRAEIRDLTLNATVSMRDAGELIVIHLTEAADLTERGQYETAQRHTAEALSLFAAYADAVAHTDAARAIVARSGREWATGRSNPVSFL